MRLDGFLAQNGLAKSRTEAKKLIEAGLVFVDGMIAEKPSAEISAQSVEVTGAICPYVSRGGLKLEAALDRFGIDVSGARCLDVGASTGGFTDCLLRRGAARVTAVDCGHGQLAPSLAADPRVTQMDGVNARDLTFETFGERFDFCCMDVSFISQPLIHSALSGLVVEGGWMVTLVKPQFEAGRSALGKNGVVRAEADRRAAVQKVIDSAEACGFDCSGVIESPITGGDGNIEYLAYFKYKG